MNNIQNALLWASAMLALAGMVAMGWVSKDAAQPILLTIPALAIVTMGKSRCCNLFNRGRG